jgi:hypothetical protein
VAAVVETFFLGFLQPVSVTTVVTVLLLGRRNSAESSSVIDVDEATEGVGEPGGGGGGQRVSL